MSYALVSKPKEVAAPVIRTNKASAGLRICDADDALEGEADRAADAVMSGRGGWPAFSLSRMTIAAPLQRECSCGGTCDACSQQTLQRSETRRARSLGAPAIVDAALRSRGHEIAPATLGFMQARFGRDFRRVRIHTDETAARSAQAVSANAYTVGERIVFGSGRYAPESHNGRRLLAHELAHVVQQQGTRMPVLQRDDVSPANETDGATGNTLLAQALKAADQRRWEVAARLANDLDPYQLKSFVQTQEILQAPGDPNWVYYLHLGALQAGLGAGSPIAKATEATYQAVKQREDARDNKQPADQNGGSPRPPAETSSAGVGGSGAVTVAEKKAQCEAGQPSDLKVFPLKLHYDLSIKKFDLTEAPIQAQRTGDEILVSQPINAVYAEPTFRRETKTLPLQTFTGGIRLRLDDVVRVHLYDFNEYRCVTGEDMLRLSHASDMATLAGILKTVGFAANLAAPGVASALAGAAVGVGAEAASQKSNVDLGLQDEIHWGQIAFDALLQLVLQKFGQSLGEWAVNKMVGVATGVSRRALELAVRSAVDGTNAALQAQLVIAANKLFESGANEKKPVTTKEFILDLADQFAQGALLGAIMAIVHQREPGVPGQSPSGAEPQAESRGIVPEHPEPKSEAQSPESSKPTPAESRRPPGPAAQNAGTAPATRPMERTPSASHSEPRSAADPEVHQSEQRTPASRPEEPQQISKEDAIAEAPTGDGHEAVVTKDAIAICSPPPCPVIHVEFERELAENPWAKKRYDEIQAMRQTNPDQAAKSAARLIKVLEMVRRRRSLPAAAPLVPPDTVKGADVFGELSAELDLPPTKSEASQQQAQQGSAVKDSASGKTPLTEQQLREHLARERGFSFSKPGAPAVDPAEVGRGIGPAAGGRAAGQAVFAAAQITNKRGELVTIGVAAYFGGGDKHAEEQALTNLERAVAHGNAEGGELLVVVDQDPCGPNRNDCAAIISNFAAKYKLTLKIRVPTGPSMRPGAAPDDQVRPRTAQMRSQREDMPPVQLRDFQDENAH